MENTSFRAQLYSIPKDLMADLIGRCPSKWHAHCLSMSNFHQTSASLRSDRWFGSVLHAGSSLIKPDVLRVAQCVASHEKTKTSRSEGKYGFMLKKKHMRLPYVQK